MFPYYKDKGDESLFQLQNLKNVICQNNCHFAMEVVIVLSGVLTVTLDDVAYDMKRRDVMLIMSYQIHSFHTKAESESVILNISKDFFRDHKKTYETQKPEDPVQTIPDADFAYIFKYLNCMDPTNSVSLYCVFYPVLNLYFKNTKFVPKEAPNDLYGKAIDYTSQHFQEDLTIKDMAKALHVNHVYLSRVFNKYSSTNFKSFLNNFRIEKAASLLKNTDMQITEISYECGFSSIRNFNRVFKNFYFCTPKEFRIKEQDKGK